ncbi:uncharacterized protein BP01DRAFT_361923 [Aspergillus saccharolyticus JOP 1030-1]|uniref:MFS general substrate transporter n=1 Tax=Aspergillus saccharolyticus JOP 1030-1 TaxID=1450539 RepID=A0A318ZS38_9EURO|nr:hypothetical protein BP01DRAFT_361923 [Aspergillus saccharolyticus JOP 1030-1]PYH49907.1 hypothetical protein BP01DRAFT_361923 [Aspergillus saccharolyticus JOP 1030-1]
MSSNSLTIATAIPRITSQFNTTGDIGWYGSAYFFDMCALQPIAGKLFARFPIYYIPEWFQVIKGASPTKSGLMYLPLALSDALSATLTGASLKFLGYPNPHLLLETALISIATGLCSSFTPSTPHERWIPSQVLQGLGAGMTLSMSYVATQTVLQPVYIPFFGAAVNLVIAEAIFDNKLVAALDASESKDFEIQKILDASAAEVRSVVPDADLDGVLHA